MSFTQEFSKPTAGFVFSVIRIVSIFLTTHLTDTLKLKVKLVQNKLLRLRALKKIRKESNKLKQSLYIVSTHLKKAGSYMS